VKENYFKKKLRSAGILLDFGVMIHFQLKFGNNNNYCPAAVSFHTGLP
jgi:hypothetical protein